MSLRKFIRHSDGNCEKGIGFLDENESRYSSKFHHNSVLHDSMSQGKWGGSKSSMANSYNSGNGQKSERTNHMASKSFSKDGYSSESYKGKSSSRSSPSRPNAGSGSMFNSQKSHSRNSADDFEWSQHVSSSGKVYYYNKKSERSQWEKPREWIEREQQRNKERYSSYKEGSRESRDSSRYSRSSSRRDGTKDVSSYNKRERQSSDRDRQPKVIKTEGASTAAASTVTSRSSVGSTPDSGSPSCSSSGLQDISPPTTPTHVNMVSPYVNATTPVNVLSPHLYSCSPVNLQSSSAALMNQSSPSTNSYAQVQSRLAPSGAMSSPASRQNSVVANSSAIMLSSSSSLSPRTLSSPAALHGSGGIHSSVTSELQHNPLLINSNCTNPGTERISPTPPLHPLQQATLLQKQQMAGGLMGHKMTGVLHALGPGYLSHVGQCENSPPPPPPPHGVLKKQLGRQDSYEHANRNADLRTNAPHSRSSPLPHKHGLAMSEPSPNSKKYSKSLEPLIFPELKDIQGFSSLCSKEIYEDVAGWYGNVLDRQANSCWEEAMHSLTQEGCRTRANWILGNFVYDILDTRVEVIDRKLACLREVHNQVESLQDLRSGS